MPVKIALGCLVMGTLAVVIVSGLRHSGRALTGNMFLQSKIGVQETSGSRLIAVRIVNAYTNPVNKEVPHPDVRTHVLGHDGLLTRMGWFPDYATQLWFLESAEDYSGKQVMTLRPTTSPDRCLKLTHGDAKPRVVACDQDDGDDHVGQVSDAVVFDGLFLYNQNNPDDIICSHGPENPDYHDWLLESSRPYVRVGGGKSLKVKAWCMWRLETVVAPYNSAGAMGQELKRLHEEETADGDS